MLNLNHWRRDSVRRIQRGYGVIRTEALRVVVSTIPCLSCVAELCRSKNSRTNLVIILGLPIQCGYGVVRTEALSVVSPSYLSSCARCRVAALRLYRTVLQTDDDVSTKCVLPSEVELCD